MSNGDDDDTGIRPCANLIDPDDPYNKGRAHDAEDALKDAGDIVDAMYAVETDTGKRAQLQQIKTFGNTAKGWIHGCRTQAPVSVIEP
jgi:hypothetical protein